MKGFERSSRYFSFVCRDVVDLFDFEIPFVGRASLRLLVLLLLPLLLLLPPTQRHPFYRPNPSPPSARRT